MQLINSATNAAVGGYVVPPGSYTFPLEGSIGIVTGAGATNLVVGSGDTLIVWETGAAVEPGQPTWEWFLLGVWLVVGVFGLMAMARRIASRLDSRVREV